MAAALGTVAPLVLGGLGLLQNSQNARSANNIQNQGLAALQPQVTAQQDLLGQAQGYSPATQDAIGFQVANNNATQNIGSSLKQLNGSFLGAGGSPTGDTAFQGAANRTAAGIAGPLALQQAQMVSSEPQRKMQALQSVFSAPAGNLANSYFNAAQQKAPSGQSWQSALNYLGQGLGGAFQAPGSNLIGDTGSATTQGSLGGAMGLEALLGGGAGSPASLISSAFGH
jgi:hypothetical protein